jgi:acyl carrier protein
MGLDIVEFVMAVEVAFGIDIANADAERLRTPRDVLTHVRSRLPDAPTGAPCITQQAFYRTRRALITRFGRRRRALRPATALAGLVPAAGRAEHWRALRADLAVEAWPRFPEPGWRTDRFDGPQTLGDLARHLAQRNAAAMKGGAGWTDAEIERTVIALIESELGVDMAKFTLDSSFVEDMGAD